MNLLQINSAVNTCSHGLIAEEIGRAAQRAGFRSVIAYGRDGLPSHSEIIPIGTSLNVMGHVLKTRLLDRHGFGSGRATRELLAKIIVLDPDMIHLHNIHGYYLHVGFLFRFLKSLDIPVVWTLHDCWPFTGHCAIFERVKCTRWKNLCYRCPLRHAYPESWWRDRSRRNFLEKRELFTGHPHLHIVTPSHWLEQHVRDSFLGGYPVHLIRNGIDLEIFHPGDGHRARAKYGLGDQRIILGVANTWKKRKALDDFLRLTPLLDKREKIVLVGIDQERKTVAAAGIIALPRMESREELAELYSAADVFVNPTYADNLPTTNIEALACGTPVVAYNTGGCSEIVDSLTGEVVDQGDIAELREAISRVLDKGKEAWSPHCRRRAESLFGKEMSSQNYIRLYRSILDEGGVR